MRSMNVLHLLHGWFKCPLDLIDSQNLSKVGSWIIPAEIK